MSAPDWAELRRQAEAVRAARPSVPDLDTVRAWQTDLPERVLALLDRAEAAEAERDGANALVERMHAQDVRAIQAWQAAHPDAEPLTWPGNSRLSAWCLGEIADLRAQLAAARQQPEGRTDGQ